MLVELAIRLLTAVALQWTTIRSEFRNNPARCMRYGIPNRPKLRRGSGRCRLGNATVLHLATSRKAARRCPHELHEVAAPVAHGFGRDAGRAIDAPATAGHTVFRRTRDDC